MFNSSVNASASSCETFSPSVARSDLTQKREELPIEGIVKQSLAMQGEPEVDRRMQLVDARLIAPGAWPKAFPKAHLDCEGLAHYLMTGTIGKFEKTQNPTISRLDLEKPHKPYTCYELWKPNAPWVREEMGFWGPHHFFTHLEDGEYVSKNGGGPIRVFSSFMDMLLTDGYHRGVFITEDYKDTDNIEQAVIGESLVGTIELPPELEDASIN